MDDGQDIVTCLKGGSSSELEIDEEMEMDEGSAGEEEEEEVGDPASVPSPEQEMAFDHGSSGQSEASGFPFSQDDTPTVQHKHSHISGKPLSARRGPGRPRKDKPSPRSAKKSIGLKLKGWKSNVFVHGIEKSPTLIKEESQDGGCAVLEDAEPPPELASPVRSIDETPTTCAHFVERDTGQSECSATAAKPEKIIALEEPPYFQEQWPGKVCALCNLGERSQLGQGDLMRFSCPEGFTPYKSSPTSVERSDAVEMMSPSSETYAGDAADRESIGSSGGDKSPRGSSHSIVTGRRQKGLAKSRNPLLGTNVEQLDELSIVGFPEEPEIVNIFEISGHFYVHQSCALWSSGVTRTEDLVMENVGPAVLEACKRRCSHCNHFGGTITCIVTSCARVLHFPCAAASGAFQDCKTVTMVCGQHLDQVPLLLSGEVTCMICFALGDVSNLMMCTNCGHHYHGSCVGLALLPGVRAGWQCPDCRVCQVCRQPEEDSKVMLCEKCDKAYHPQCLRPIVTTIPKIGWKCKCCRVCSDCGSRTPGAGLSSRWHAHYTVCDSCYQQRNKGFSCPLCRRAYRAAAYREMVQCGHCRKFVHGTCDTEADLTVYNRKKESNPDYEYICPICKPRAQLGKDVFPKRKDSTEDAGMESSLTGPQESVCAAEDTSMEVDYSSSDKYSDEGPIRAVGLGKGKPFCASKIAKKKLGLSSVAGRPKGIGKSGSAVGKVVGGYQKRQRVLEFGRKRAPKAKMRGIFGVPGLGLQRPQADCSFNKSDEEPGVENRLVLCSAKDKFVLTQDMCVMCGAIGIDQEGCLISCAQCGQCYHPYCVNVKVTKVILQKGWRCLDCTVCEGCGQRNDEARLILCDDCDISFHIYCMDPPLDYVPHGNWKCKWCAICLSCGSNDPGFNCMWQKSFTECGPCASHTTCPSCLEGYNEGDLIIQCVQCERWLHCLCDQIHTEADAERCAEDGYNCVLCRPRDVPPPHLQPTPPPPKPPTPTKSPEAPKFSSQAQFYMDGVCLSEMGLHQIKSLTMEQQQQSRKKRITKKIPTKADKEAGILATIESVVAGGSLDSSLEHDPISKLELDEAKEDAKMEPVEVYKEGMVVPPREDGRPPDPPEGFTIHTTESGVMVLRRKRQRNLQKLGIGGFNARLRSTRNKEKDEEGGGEVTSGAVTPTSAGPASTSNVEGGSAPEDKPRRKAQRRRPKNRLMESYPSYLQEAFFGRDLLDTTKEKDVDSSSDSDDERASPLQVSDDKIIQLSQDELKVMEEMKAKQEKDIDKDTNKVEGSESGSVPLKSPGKDQDDGSDTEGLKDILPGDLLDTDLVNTIMNDDDDITKSEDNLDDIGDAALADDSLNDSLSVPDGSADVSGTSHKDELADVLSPNFNLESMVSHTGLPNMDSKDVEEIFKGVLTDESQESEDSVFPLAPVGTPVRTSAPHNVGSVTHSGLQSGVTRAQVSGSLPSVGQPNLSPVSFPPPSPYHSEYSNSPFSEPPSPWLSQADVEGFAEGGAASTSGSSVNKQSILKIEADEELGSNATISSVLYANVNHPEWKKEFPVWADRYKQILKKWRALPSDRKAPFLQQARENRAALRMRRAQQIPKDITKPSVGSISPQSTPSTSGGTGVVGGPPQLAKKAASGRETGGPVAWVQQKSDAGGSISPSSNVVEDQEKIMQQQKTCREAEQERQWKQLQALRQQQAQQQQQTIHDQRVQAMARVHRQMSADGVPFSPDQAVPPISTQLQVSTTQDPNAVAPLSSPSPGSRTQFPSPQVKVSRVHTLQSPGSTVPFSHPNLPPPPLPPPHPASRQEPLTSSRPTTLTLPRGAPTAVVRQSVPASETLSAARLPFPGGCQPRSPFSPQSPHDQFPQSPVSCVTPTTPQAGTSLVDPFQRTPSETPSDPYSQPPHTPRQEFIANGQQSPVPQRSPVYVSAARPASDPYATPRPQFSSAATRPTPQIVYAPSRVQQQPQQQDPYTSQPRPAQFDPYVQQIPTPRPQDPYTNQSHAPRPQQVDPYAQQPATPRPRTEGEIFSQQQQQQGPEVNTQLRDLLQRQQHIKKLEQDQAVPGLSRLWSQQDGQPSGQEGGIHAATQQQTSQVQQTQQQTATHFETSGAAPVVHQQQAPTSPHPVTATNSDGTFRQPLPPALARPRLPSQGTVVVRNPTGVRHPLQGLDPRLQGVDPRTKLLIHQQRGVIGYPTQIVHRLAGPRNPLDPYDHLVQQRQQLGFAQDSSGSQGVLAPNATVIATQRLVRQNTAIEGGHANQLGVQMRLTRVSPQPGHSVDHRAPVSQTTTGPGQVTLPSPVVSSVVGICAHQTLQQHVASPSAGQQVTASAADTQEIPESVTAELEKLEQEGGAMVEVEGVGAILAELGDDKELLEMGNDFNILEYADPELDSVTGGEKTNILDENLDLEEDDSSKEEHKGVKKELPDKNSNNSESTRPDKPADSVEAGKISSSRTVIKDDANSSSATPSTAVEGDPAGAATTVVSQPVATPQSQQLQQTTMSSLSQQPPISRPVGAGRMVSPDGGTAVSFQNTFPPTASSPAIVPTGVTHLQRLPPAGHLQVQQQRVQMRMVPGAVREGPARVISVVPGGPVIQHSGVGVSAMGLAPPPPPPPYPGPPPPYPGPCQQEQPLLLEDLLEQEKREQEKQQQQQPPPASASPPLLSDVDFERLRADVLGTTTPTGGSPGLGSPPQGIPAQGLLPSPNLVSVVGTNLRPPYPPRPAPQTTSKLIEWQSGPSSGLDSKMGPSGVLVRQQSTPGEATAGRVPLFNAPHLPTPPLPPENIMTEQDRQTQLHYEQWLNHQNQIVSSQLKYYETEVSKLRKIRKSLNSKQRQLRKSGNELTEADALELQRISSEQSVLQKQLDASRKQSRQHGMLIQEYRNKQQQKQRQQQGPGSVGPPSLLIGPPVLGSSTPQQQSVVIHSPLGRPASSPVHHPSTPQSPMMSPSPSPMMQQHPSPLHSPGPLLSHSPGPGSVTCMLQHSPGNPGPGSSSGMSPHSLQPSPRMGTPHSQSEESPFSPGTPQEMLRSLPSPQQVCPPPAGRLASPQGHGAPRMTSPQHRMGVPTPQGMGRLVTSPVSYTGDHRTVQQQFSGGEQIRINMPPRFVRSPISGNSEPALLRPRGLPIQGPGQMGPTNVMYSQPSPTQNVRAGIVYSSSSSPSPLGSPQPVVSNVVGQQQQFQQITSQSGQQQTGHSQQQTSVHFQQAQTGVSGQMVVRQVQQSVGQQSPQQMVQRQLQQHLLQQQQQPQEQEANLLLAQRQQLQLAQQRQMIHQQRQQILQHQQLAQQRQQQQMLQQQPNQPPSSPMPPRSPIIHQQHQNSSLPPSSPMPPRSPMVQSLNQSQTPNSPVPPHSPMLQQMNQTQPLNSPMPPCSPVVQQQYQQIGQNQPPSSPVLRNSMVQNLPHSVGSPMQMRHPSSTGSVSNSPVLPDRPQSVENPLTPRTPHTPHTPQSSQQGGEFGQGHLEHQDNDTAPGGGGGNPNNPANPLPLPAMFGRFGYFKLGLRGGSPMWSTGTGFRRGGRHGSSKCNDEKGNGSGEHQDKDAGVGTCGTKTKGQVESKSALQSCSSARETRSIVTPGKTVAVVSKVASLVCVDYNDFDDENSHTPPLTPPPSQAHEVCVPSSVLIVDNKEENLSGVAKIISEQDLSSTEKSDESASEKSSVLVEIEKEVSSNTKELIGEKCGEEIEVSVISHEDILDADTVVSSDLAIEDADCDNVVVFESDLAQVSSSIDTDVIEECIVTSSDIVMDISVVDALGDCDKLTSCIQKDDDILHLVDEESKVESGDIMETADVDDELGEIELAEGNDDMPNMDMDVMHILDSRVTGMLDRDPVLDMPEGCREIHSMNERLRIGIVRSLGALQQEKIVAITDTPESPDQEEMNVDPSPEPYLPTPDTIKDDEDDMMPMMHDDADMMELDDASRTPVTDVENVTELDIVSQTTLDLNVTSSAEMPVMDSVVHCQASMDTVEDSSSEALKSVVSEATTQISSSGKVARPDLSCGLTTAAQLPISGVHQANRTAVVTFPGLTVPATSYSRGQLQNLSPLLVEEHTFATDTVSVLNTLIASAVAPVTRQVTSLVPSAVAIPRSVPFALDSELTNSTGTLPVQVPPATSAKEKLEETPSTLTASYLTSPSAVVTEGVGITVTSEVGLTAPVASPGCSTAAVPLHADSLVSTACVTSDSAPHMHSSVTGASPTFSIIKSATASSSPRRTSVLQGSAGSLSAMSAVPVCIIRSQSGGSGSGISTTVSLISSAVASTVALPVTSSQLTSATVANLVADAVNAARLPYPPASVGQHLAFTTASVVPLVTASPAGVSVIASASTVSLGGISMSVDSLVPPPRMSTAPVTSSQSVSPRVPVTVETNSSIIPIVDTKQSSGENQNYIVKHAPPTSVQANAEEKDVDIRSKYLASQSTGSQKEDTEILADMSSKFSQVTRPSMLENTSQNLNNELPLQSVGTEPSSVCAVQNAPQKVDDDDDEILMKTMQLIFQDTRPSVLATVERVPQSAAAVVQQETAGTETDRRRWQHNIPDTSSIVGSVIVTEDKCSSDTQQSLVVSISSPPVTDKEPIKELTLADKLLHPPVQDSLSASNKIQAVSKPYPVPSSNLPTVFIEPHQREEVRMDYEDGDKTSDIPKKTNASYSHNILPASQIEPSTNLKLPLQTTESTASSEALVDVLRAPSAIPPETSAVFSSPSQSTVTASTTSSEVKSIPETALSSKVVKSTAVLPRSVFSGGLSDSGQSMLACRLSTIASGPPVNTTQTSQSAAPQGIMTSSEIVSQIATVPVPMSTGCPVVMTPRISSTAGRFSPIVNTGQAVASVVRQYVAYTQQQVASQTSPVIAGISRSLSMPSPAHSPHLPAQGSVSVLAPTTAARVISSKSHQSLAAEQFVQSRTEAPPVLTVSSSVMQSQATVSSMPQPSGTILQTRVSAPPSASGLAAIQHVTSYEGTNRTDGDIETVVTSALERLGRDVILSVSSESATSSRNSDLVDSSKYPYASSAPPRIQSSCSVFSSVMYPQRRMSAGEIKVEEPARSCQFEQLTAVKTETLDLCLFQESPVPTTSIIMQQQQHSSPTLTSISKPVATSCIMASQPSVATIVPKTETQHLVSSCKFSSTTQALSQPQQQAPVPAFPHRMEESQNVLLKQLLQNTGCAQTQSQQTSSVPTHHHGAPSLPVVPSLEAQLARPVPPTPSSLLPPLLTNDSPQSQTPQLSRQLSHLTTRETSLVSRPPPQLSTSLSIPVQTDRRPDPPNRENVLSPPATLRSCANVAESNLHEPTPLSSPHVVTIKKEVAPPLQSPSADVKKETVSDDSSEQVASEKKEFHGKTEQPSKDEIGDLGMEASCDKTTQDQAALDAKKVKRRLYQQKRRQSQGKEPTASGGTPKKQRIRKGSKVDEDYDTYIENLMMQLRQLPPMSVLEPALSRNYAVCSIFGSGDLTKIGTTRDYSTRHGDLKGSFCAAYLAHVSDHYNTQPFGDLPPLPPQPPVSTQRGFYDQEFAALKLENDDDKRPDGQTSGNRDRGNDTPDTVVSSSSPECVIHELPIRFPGLKLIEEEDSEKEEETRWMKRSSPIIPIISPIPIRLRPGMQMAKEISDVDKENVGVTRDHIQLKTRFGVYPPAPLRDAGNVTVTLTLTSAAAGDILGVLRHLANILSIPAPSGYQIVERTSTPPSQKLGLYRTKGKDGKEGAPVDIQSILNGAAKFCRHCDVVILSSLIRKKASELPFLAKDDVVENGDDLYFCSSACYMQFALMHRSPSISEDKAAAIVDHLCQTAESPSQQKKVCPPESTEKVKEDERSEKKVKEEDEQMDVDRQLNEFEDVKTEQDDAEKSESAEPRSIPTQSKKTESVSVNTEVPLEKLEKKPASGTVPTASAVATVTVPSSTLHQGTSSDKRSRRHTGDDQAIAPSSHCPPPTKLWKGVKYKYWTPGAIQPAVKYKKPTDKEVTEMLFRMGITMTPAKIPEDTRKCMFCHQIGDGVGDGTARLLNFDVDKWVHLNCALWSDDVYETVNGALMNLENSLQQSLVLSCVVCHRMGATIRCFKLRCSNVYHLGCAVKDGCVFFKNKSTYCSAHIPKNEKDNELTTLSVFRRVYVNRDENRQVATVMHQDHNNLLRVGSLIFLSVGQLLPHQLQAFHTPNYIYPIGYKIVRFYWSMRVPNKRCRYVCSIHDVAGRPEFRVLVQEPCQDDLELRDCTPRAVWARILEPLASLRKEMGGVQVFPRFISGEDLFGLTEPAVVRVLESLPGVETLTDYRFKYGRNPLLELPLAVNPTGCARTEPKLRNQFLWKRPHTQRTGSSSRPIFVPTASMAGEAACPYSKQFVHSKSSQYKKMKQEWRNNVYLARSKIQGLGLYAARDLERHTMVIEYIGEVIRTELSELREKQYEARNRGIYMFRLDEDRVVDATLSGGLARYINHSCNPNCVAEIVEVERDLRIIIFAKRRISRGEELAYDYKFDIEDDQHKIPCNCGAPNCRKWMN